MCIFLHAQTYVFYIIKEIIVTSKAKYHRQLGGNLGNLGSLTIADNTVNIIKVNRASPMPR